MTVKEYTVIKYISFDGYAFKTEKECLKYEEERRKFPSEYGYKLFDDNMNELLQTSTKGKYIAITNYILAKPRLDILYPLLYIAKIDGTVFPITRL